MQLDEFLGMDGLRKRFGSRRLNGRASLLENFRRRDWQDGGLLNRRPRRLGRRRGPWRGKVGEDKACELARKRARRGPR